jgi:hypothetical protein
LFENISKLENESHEAILRHYSVRTELLLLGNFTCQKLSYTSEENLHHKGEGDSLRSTDWLVRFKPSYLWHPIIKHLYNFLLSVSLLVSPPKISFLKKFTEKNNFEIKIVKSTILDFSPTLLFIFANKV